MWNVFNFSVGFFRICILLIQIHYKLITSVIWIFQTFGLEFWASRMKTFSNIRQLCCLVIIEIKVIKIWIEVNELQHLESFYVRVRKYRRYLRTRTSCSHQKSHSSAAFSCTPMWDISNPCVATVRAVLQKYEGVNGVNRLATES